MGTEFRHEYKYLCTYSQLVLLRKRLESLLARDIHAGPEGTYLIRSVYFDDPNNSCYYENEDGVDPRSKYRLRIYKLQRPAHYPGAESQMQRDDSQGYLHHYKGAVSDSPVRQDSPTGAENANTSCSNANADAPEGHAAYGHRSI